MQIFHAILTDSVPTDPEGWFQQNEAPVQCSDKL